MSNWGRSYNSNRNQNYYQNPYSNYAQIDGNSTYENWATNYGISQNNPYSQNSTLYIANGSGSYNGEATFPNAEYSADGDRLQLYNMDINSEVWERAANSQLTPTAGEFIPSSTFHSSNAPQLQESSQPIQLNHTPRNQNNRPSKNNENPSTSHVPYESTATSVPETTYPQRRNFDKVRSRNTDNRRQVSIEQSKAEGRKKLLQEAAGLAATRNDAASTPVSGPSRIDVSGPLRNNVSAPSRNDVLEPLRNNTSGPSRNDASGSTKNNAVGSSRHVSASSSRNVSASSSRNDSAGPSRAVANSSDYSSRWRPRSSGDKAPQHTSRNGGNGDSKPFARSGKVQDNYYQTQRYSPPRKVSSGASPRRDHTQASNNKVDDAASQRDRLTDQLNRGTLECLVCCEHVRQTDSTWSCNNCYHVLHLRCIIKWANTSKAENGWRCPACQNVTVMTPHDYFCFCGKAVSPEWNRSDTAHSCGEVCNRPKVLASEHYSCVHRCTLLCHPGPCPPCMALVTRKCGCGQSSQTVQCGQIQPLVCSAICDKPLSCGLHRCADKCHLGECQSCQYVIKQVCHCGNDSREVMCDGKNSEDESFTCGAQCKGTLTCGQHQCKLTCHEGSCGDCPWDPTRVTHCHCGKTPLGKDQSRSSCLDPVPTCGQVCARQLTCGQPSNPHQCQAVCHEGPCPPCDKTTFVRCRCGYMDQEIPCVELTTKADDARCQKKCTKKRTCGKHKCNQLCCIDVDHLCPLPCNHILSCGQHRCDQLCHRGHCQACLQSSFEELYCECGSSVLLPPIPCGTKPPPCNKLCTRPHDCDHEVLHFCHSYARCPPCSILTTRYCHGKHELRKAVPCHMREFSCGLPCNRALVCGRHKCIQPCHNGECTNVCRQPCTKPRDLCGHACAAPCHEGDCLDTPCKESVVVTCECGYRTMSRPCYENSSEYQRIATSLLASKMADVQLGRSVNLDDMQAPRKISIKTLECSEECRVMERNRRLAIGLQIRNPDLSAKLTPRYSDFMRGWAKKDQRFCQHVHDKLTELVKLAKESKQKSRSYSFETMNRDKRQFVHEYCTHFGCESVAYDAEPKRNVVATAQRDKAWLPSYSLLEVVQREMGLRKVPLPNLNSSIQKSNSQSNVLPVRVTLNQPAKSQLPDNTPQIDYFDYNNG